jgi:hypothetical protein
MDMVPPFTCAVKLNKTGMRDSLLIERLPEKPVEPGKTYDPGRVVFRKAGWIVRGLPTRFLL